ncbi:MAG: hypothetical protein U0269_15020 [Polyangiales bacterium]
MRWPRPVYVFSTVAAVLVLWFIARMGFGSNRVVWQLSCLLGAWAPLLSAVLFAYVRAVGDREHTVGVAWLVRAIGMHCVLLWMIGVGDWLAGFATPERRWIADVAAPVVLLGFAPAFAVSFAAVEWVRSVARRVPRTIEKPALPTERAHEAAFRGVRVVREAVSTEQRATWGYLLGATAIAANVLLPSHAFAVTAACALIAAVMATRNASAFVPSLSLLAFAPLVALVSRVSHGELAVFTALALAPWAMFAAVGALTLPLDVSLRFREAPAKR